MAHGIPDEAANLIIDHIDSVEQLEILLLLHRHAGRTRSAAEVANELRVEAGSAQRRLEDLAGRAFVEKDGAGFSYRSNNPRDGAVRLLADTYRERRVSVITLIFSKPPKAANDPVRALADAFKIKRGPKDG